MPKRRGREHTSLTETAQTVVRELEKIPGIKMIAPGEIHTNARKRGGAKFTTVTITSPGFELLISGQAVQKVSVHTDEPEFVYQQLTNAKPLKDFEFKKRERKPGV